MTVFIEYVLIDNFVIDYLLLSLSLRIVGVKTSRLRLILSAGLGAVFSLVYPLFDFIVFIEIAIKLLFGLLMVIIVAKYKSGKSCYLTAVIFNALTFLTGGIILGVGYMLSINLSSELSVALMILPVLAIVRFIKSLAVFLKTRNRINQYSYKVFIEVLGKNVSGVGFLDTGNCAFDGVNPIVFCTKDMVNNFIALGIIIPMYRINVKTVTGSLDNLSFKADKFIICLGQDKYEFNSVTVCVSKNLPMGIDVLIHPALMEDINAKKIDKETQKAC